MKKGFTLVEMLLVLALIGVLISIVAYNYHGSQQRARTAENVKRAHDIINVAEQSLSLSIRRDQGYPNKNDTSGGSDWNRVFLPSLPNASRRNISTSQEPDGNNPERLKYIMCSDEDGEISGLKIAYWDYTDSKVKYLDTGITEGMTCD